MFCLQIVTQCAVLSFSSVCSNIFFSVRSALISLSKTTHLTILSTFYPPQYYHYSIHRNAILIYFSSSKLHLFKKSQILRMWVVAQEKWKEMKSKSLAGWLAGFVNLSQVKSPFWICFLISKIRITKNSINLTDLLWRLNEIKHVKDLSDRQYILLLPSNCLPN